MTIQLEPVAFVSNTRKNISDDFWGEVISEIVLAPTLPAEVFSNIEEFSHLEILFHFSQTTEIVYSGRPRDKNEYPLMGIFAQRKKNRPNHIGLTTVELISHDNRKIVVKGLDANDGTPVLDIKPVYKEFGVRGTIRQPVWVEELMKDYWK
jgi:tRNA-Thr(GGU) m(6)t(6)A37 methyltransferase TsaA